MEVIGKIEGADAILAKLKQLPVRIGRNALRRSLRKGANVIRDMARQNAKTIDDPETAEQIWKNITVASGGARREREAGGLLMRVGVQGGARFDPGAGGPGGNTSGYWRFVEFGTSNMRAQPFMRPAGSQGAAKALSAITDDMQKQLDKELAKLR